MTTDPRPKKLHEDRPYTPVAGDGLNPNSYAAIAVWGLVSLATEVLHENGQPMTRDTVRSLSHTFASLVLNEQSRVTGSTNFQDGMNTRVRGALRTALNTLPPPFGQGREEWDSWFTKMGNRLRAISDVAIDLWNVGLVTDAYALLVTEAPAPDADADFEENPTPSDPTDSDD